MAKLTIVNEKALDEVIDYFIHDASYDYHKCPPSNREGHIYNYLRILLDDRNFKENDNE